MKKNVIKQYSNLIKTVAITDFKLKYEGSVLGYLWSLMKPLFLFGVYYFVFSVVFKFGKEIPHYPVYLLLGIVIWSFFTEVTQTLMGSIAGKRELIRKVYFPRIVLPIANSVTSIMVLSLNTLIVFIFMFINKIFPDLNLLFIFLIFIELYIFVLGIGLFFAALYVRFRDIAHIWEIFLQALFYATPILYSPLQVSEKMRNIQILNPVAQMIQDARWSMVTKETATVWKILDFPYFLIPYVIPILTLILGYYVFEKAAAKFAEEV